MDRRRPPIETSIPSWPPAEFIARPKPGWVLTKAEMTSDAFRGLVIDARAGERYRGEVEPIDPRAGHIPGARSAPFADNLTVGAVPVFRSAGELRAQYAALGAERDEPVVYCGSGVTACHDLLALHIAACGVVSMPARGANGAPTPRCRWRPGRSPQFPKTGPRARRPRPSRSNAGQPRSGTSLPP